MSTADAVEEVSENAIRPVAPSITDPLVRKIPALTWTVHRNGTVAYNFKNGNNGFIDAGEKLIFGRSLVSDEALALTLQYAQDKWKGELKITGGDAVFKARVARIANQLGIALQNPDLKALQAQIRTQTPMQPAVSKSTLTPMKEKQNDESRNRNKHTDGIPPPHRRDSLHHLSASYLVLDTSGDVGLLRKNVSDRLAKQETGIDNGMQRPTRSNSGITRREINISQGIELSIESEVLQLVPNADIQHAITQSTRYSGKIVAENSQYLAQITSKGKVVIHDKNGFGTDMPRKGDTATIAYQSGKPTAKIRTGKTR